jgi:hypothetical protein
MYSLRERQLRRVLTREHKNLSYMFGVLRKEFDKLKELFYEWQA